MINVDFIVELPESSSHDTIMVVVDSIIKKAHFVPTVTTITAAGTARLYVQNVWRHHGGLYCAPTFHMDSIWNPSNLADSIWIPSIPYGMVLGEVPAILRFLFHMERLWYHGITGLALSHYLINYLKI
jgi:hypothetical protein